MKWGRLLQAGLAALALTVALATAAFWPLFALFVAVVALEVHLRD